MKKFPSLGSLLPKRKNRRRFSRWASPGQTEFRSSRRLEALEERHLLSALTWSSGVSLPAPRAGVAAMTTDAQSILVVGGGSTAAYHLFDGANSWSTASAIDISRVSPGLGSTGANFLVYGGSSGGTALEEALTYDPYNIDNVQDAQVLNTPRAQLAYATDANKPYALGGLNGGSVLASVERYNASSDTWTTVAPMPQGRFAFTAVADDAGHIFTFGGATANNATSVSNAVYRYNVATNTWQTMTPMPVATRESAAVFGSNGRIYVLGGRSSNSTLATVQSYDPATDTWQTETSLPTAVSSAAAVTDAQGRIELIGGYDQNHVALSTVTVSQRLDVPDEPPTINAIANTSVAVGATFTYQVVADGNPQPSYSLPTAPLGMNISPTGLLSWTPTLAQAGLNNVTVRATNVAGIAETSFSVRALTPAPTVPTGLQVSGTTTNTVSLSWNAASDSVGVAGYHVYRVTRTGFHGNTKVYTQYADVLGTSATVNVATPGTTYNFVVSAYNASGNESGKSGSVSATTQVGPTYTGPTSVSVIANHPLSFTLSASGNPNTFSYAAVSVPNGLTVNPNTGLVTWMPTDAALGSGYYTFHISNSVGTATAVVAISVTPNLPSITSTQTGIAIAGQPINAQFYQVADPYNSAPVSFSLVAAPPGATIDANTGVLSWTPTLTDLGTASITAHATNYAGSVDRTISMPVYFASAVQNVVASNVTTTGATLNWAPPAIAASPVQGYHVTASYVTRSGRFNVTHTLPYDTVGAVTSLQLTGLPTSKSFSVSVSASDGAGHLSPAGTTHFVTATAIPTVSISGGPFSYDALGHAAVVAATGLGGASVNGALSVTYNGFETLPIEPGTYAVEAYFTSADPYYSDGTGTGTLVIAPAEPAIIIDASQFTYDGAPHPLAATAYGLDGVNPIAGSFQYTYEGSSAAPSNPGAYAAQVTFVSADPRYATTTINTMLRINSTGSLVPTIAISGGPVIYDSMPHAASAVAHPVGSMSVVAGTFALLYNGSPALPVNAGSYSVDAQFISRDPSYADTVGHATLVISPAAPSIAVWADAVYNGFPQPAYASAYGVGGIGLPGSFSFTYNASATPPTNAGTYQVKAIFTSGDSNYANAMTTATQQVFQATPQVNVVGGSFALNGLPHAASAIAVGVDGVTPLSGSMAYSYAQWSAGTGTYVPIAGTPTAEGVFLATAAFTSNNSNYSGSDGTGLIVIDGTAPTSTVNDLPDEITTTNFLVSWTSNDGSLGAGVEGVDVYVSTNNGPYVRWLTNSHDGSAEFTGLANRTYAFYSIATDIVGNRELAPPEPDTKGTILIGGSLAGDANGDGTVGTADYAIWAAQFGMVGEGLTADFDHSGDVGLADYALWAANFGTTIGGGAAGAGGGLALRAASAAETAVAATDPATNRLAADAARPQPTALFQVALQRVKGWSRGREWHVAVDRVHAGW